MATYSQERFEEGRAYAKAHPAPDHIVAAVNRALRAPRRGGTAVMTMRGREDWWTK